MKILKAGLVVAVLVALALLFLLQHQAQDKLRTDNLALAQQLAQLQTDNESLSNRLAAAGNANSLSDKEHNELLKLRGEVGVLRRQTNEFGNLPKENARLKEANLNLPSILMIEDKLLEQQEQLRSANETVKVLAKNLNVPDEIQANVYSYTNSTDASLQVYQAYFKAVQTRDGLSNFVTALDKKVADEKIWLQGKLQ